MKRLVIIFSLFFLQKKKTSNKTIQQDIYKFSYFELLSLKTDPYLDLENYNFENSKF